MEKRIITTDVTEEDFSLEGNLRPQTLDDYIGQEKTKNTLKVYIEAAKQRHDALDHASASQPLYKPSKYSWSSPDQYNHPTSAVGDSPPEKNPPPSHP